MRRLPIFWNTTDFKQVKEIDEKSISTWGSCQKIRTKINGKTHYIVTLDKFNKFDIDESFNVSVPFENESDALNFINTAIDNLHDIKTKTLELLVKDKLDKRAYNPVLKWHVNAENNTYVLLKNSETFIAVSMSGGNSDRYRAYIMNNGSLECIMAIEEGPFEEIEEQVYENFYNKVYVSQEPKLARRESVIWERDENENFYSARLKWGSVTVKELASSYNECTSSWYEIIIKSVLSKDTFKSIHLASKDNILNIANEEIDKYIDYVLDDLQMYFRAFNHDLYKPSPKWLKSFNGKVYLLSNSNINITKKSDNKFLVNNINDNTVEANTLEEALEIAENEYYSNLDKIEK